MNATVHVMLVTAVWQEPALFSGWFELESDDGRRRARYAFRAEQSLDGECRFSRLERLDLPEWRLPRSDDGVASLELLAVALGGAVRVLRARTLERFGEGQPVTAAPDDPAGPAGFELGDLGFQVSFPFVPAGESAVRALGVLLARDLPPRGPPLAQA